MLFGNCRLDAKPDSSAQPPQKLSRNWQLDADIILAAEHRPPLAAGEGQRNGSNEADRLATAATERDILAQEQQRRTQELVDSMWQSLE